MQVSSETLLFIHSSGSDNLKQYGWNNLTDNVGAISSLCLPLSAHEAKFRDWKQLCQGEDAGDLLDKISFF